MAEKELELYKARMEVSKQPEKEEEPEVSKAKGQIIPSKTPQEGDEGEDIL